MIVATPQNVFKPGFQMSFFAVLGICFAFSEQNQDSVSKTKPTIKILKNIFLTIKGSLFVTLATLPPQSNAAEGSSIMLPKL